MQQRSPRRTKAGRLGLRPCVLAAATLVLAPPASAQGTRVLHGRVVALNRASVEGIRLRVFATNDLEVSRSGEFTLEVRADAKTVSVSVVPPATRDRQQPAWTIAYPLAGLVPVPVGDDPIVIVVGEPVEETVTKALAERARQSQQILREYGVQLERLGSVEEGIERILARLDVKEADLRDRVERKQRQSDAYPPIAAAVNRYVLEARDLRTALELLGPLIKTSRQKAFETLKLALNEYSGAYEALRTHADGFGSDIEQAWDDGRLARRDFDDFFRNSVERTHATQVLPLNDVLVTIQKGLLEGRKDAELREALDELSRRVQGLGSAVDALGEGAARALERLRPEGV